MPLDAIGYIKPSLQNIFLTDLTQKVLNSISTLCPINQPTAATAFPATGRILGLNHRLMIHLACRPENGHQTRQNLLFIINTGSPVSYLSAQSMQMLTGKVSQCSYIYIHSKRIVECHLSHGDFEAVNVLGMDFMSNNRLSISMNYNDITFELTQLE